MFFATFLFWFAVCVSHPTEKHGKDNLSAKFLVQSVILIIRLSFFLQVTSPSLNTLTGKAGHAYKS